MSNPYDSPTGPNDDCGCPQAEHWHGTYVCYVVDRCRCDACRDANARYDRHRIGWLAGARPAPLVPSGRARGHINRLRAQGMGSPVIAAEAGLPQSVVSAIVWGRYDRAASKIRRETEAAILAVELRLAAGRRVPAAEAWQIVDELIARGWWKAEIGRRVHGPTATSLQLGRLEVTVAHLATLRRLLYEPIPERRHNPTGRTYRPQPKRPPRPVTFTTPGVPIPEQERQTRPGMAGRLTCAVCAKPLADHQLTERCA